MNKKARKKILSLLLTLCLIAVALPGMTMTAHAATGTMDVGKTTVADLTADASGTGWTWTANTSTLALTTGYPSDAPIQIECSDTVNLVYSGDVQINASDKDAINCKANLIVNGSGGILTLKYTGEGSCAGIAVKNTGNNLTINSGTISAESKCEGYVAAIYCENGFVKINGTASVTANATTESSFGAYGIWAQNGDVTINTTGVVAAKGQGNQYAIGANQNINIINSTVRLTHANDKFIEGRLSKTGESLYFNNRLQYVINTDITADFTDANFKQYVLDNYDGNGDGKIQASEVANVTELRIGNKSIASLAGIEHFTSLNVLSCNDNQLTSLPKLPDGLKELRCSNNQLTSLPQLPGGLQILSCSDNQLTSLPQLPDGLQILSCFNNLLTGLNVTNLSQLETLVCGENLMTSREDVIGVANSGLADSTSTFTFDPQCKKITVKNGTAGTDKGILGNGIMLMANDPPSGQLFKKWIITPTVVIRNGKSETDANIVFSMPSEAVSAIATYEYANGDPVPFVPSAPQNLTATAGDEQVTLTWTAPENDGGSAITAYYVTDGTRDLASGNTTTYTLLTLTNGTPYTLYVYAENSVGPGLKAAVTAIPTAGVTTHNVTFDPNGGTHTGGGALSQTVQHGTAATAPTVTRSGYTFTGWDKSFSNVTANMAVTAQWSSNGGGGNSGGGGSGGGGSYTPSTPTITTDKQINQPVMVKQDVASKIDANGNATASITEAMLKTLIDKGKASGNIGEGIGVQLNLDFASKASSVSTQLDAAALDLLISMGVDRLDLNSPLMNFSFDKAAIDEMNKQMTGTVMISAKPVTKLSDEAQRLIGNRPVFDLTVNDSTGKAVTNFGKGVVTLGFAYKPGADEKVGNLCGVYIPANGQPQILTNSSQDGDRLIFSRSSFSTYGVGYKTTASEFTDTKTHWAKDDIDFVVSRGLVSGTTATDFAPDKAMTRGIFLTALGKLSVADVSGYKTSSFTDVKNTDPTMPYIEWAVKNNIVNGMGNNKFAPDATITREQMAVMMQNYAKVTNYTMPVVHQATVFADDDKISSWAADAVKSMQQSGIISGKNNNKFDPQGNATRAEASAILRRFVELVIDKGVMVDGK